MPSGEKSGARSLYVRPVAEEFKAFVQHKIEVLEKFRNVEQLKVFLDAMELGLETIRDIQTEDREPEELTEVEFQGAQEGPDGAPPVEEEPGVDTEELVTDGGEDSESDEEWALAKAGEVLVGEEEEEGEEEGEKEGETNDTKEEGADSKKGVLTCKWDAFSDEGGEAEEEEEKEREEEKEEEQEPAETQKEAGEEREDEEDVLEEMDGDAG